MMKMNLGPAREIKCNECGVGLSVPWKSSFLIFPLMGLFYLELRIPNSPLFLKILIVIATLLISIARQYYFVPLIIVRRKEDKK